MKNIVILISGAGSNMLAIATAAEQERWDRRYGARIAAVISNRADAGGLELARRRGIATAVVPHRDHATREAFDAALAAAIEPHAPTLVVLAGFMRILTPGFIDRFKGRLVNIHPSLLPAFPGLDTHRRAIEAGCKVAGLTVHEVTVELDHGPILAQAVVPLLPDDTPESLAKRVLAHEHRVYPQAIAARYAKQADTRRVSGYKRPMLVSRKREGGKRPRRAISAVSGLRSNAQEAFGGREEKMERADFVHLVRLSEHASADNSQRYRRGVAAFAALGYLWVVACLLLAVGLLAWLVAALLGGGHFSIGHGWLLLFALALLSATLRALWVRFDEPDGVAVTREDAPMLFESLERIRRKIDGPPVHRVYLDGEFNASIRQLPRFGLFGGAMNYLSIGLPLLMALDRRRLLSVLAHEYGHLRGNHGRLSAWIYRTRLSWLKLDASFQRNDGVMAFASQAFFRWYFPRFAARTFALARHDEYEADRVAARLLGTRVVASALTEIAVKSHWYAERFWPGHWSRAIDDGAVPGPFSAMRARLCRPMDEDFARVALRSALRSVSDVDDTHPVLRDRLEALDERPRLPSWSSNPALSMLADPDRWTAHFDGEWCRAHDADWKEHHAHLCRLRERTERLAASAGSNSADEMVEWADCDRRLDPAADVRGRYERALQITADHAGALRGLAQVLPADDRSARLAVLERLHESSMASRWWAAKTAVELLEDPDGGGHDDRALKLWRDRAKEAEAAEQRAWEEITGTPFFSQITRHDLSDFELGQLCADLVRCPAVASAWVVRKNLREFPWRRAYVVFLDLQLVDDEERWHLCRQLEQTLSLPGAALVLWAGHSPTLAEIERKAFGAVWTRQPAAQGG